ncbi:MAG: biopolymer transporter ExbD [Spirochaetaceae bacterium]|jgi:biopolymer transport protein ExbD|nr:biopolymer transporter ExbD [Spirochaetaceae bacterium]
MKNFGGERSPQSDINITSLIDVIFMLVVFFMLGASFEKPAISLELPRAASGERTEKMILTVSVDSGGRIYVDGSEAGHEELAARLAAGGPETVALECDGRAAFSAVIAVVDTIKAAGVRNVALRHEPK